MKSELTRIGFLGDTPCSYEAMPLAAHFELHIGENSYLSFDSFGGRTKLTCSPTEQGPILEAANKLVGVVRGAQAYRWYTIDVYVWPSYSKTLFCAAY